MGMQKKIKSLLVYEEKFADSLNDIHRVIKENDSLNQEMEQKSTKIAALQK